MQLKYKYRSGRIILAMPKGSEFTEEDFLFCYERRASLLEQEVPSETLANPIKEDMVEFEKINERGIDIESSIFHALKDKGVPFQQYHSPGYMAGRGQYIPASDYAVFEMKDTDYERADNAYYKYVRKKKEAFILQNTQLSAEQLNEALDENFSECYRLNNK